MLFGERTDSFPLPPGVRAVELERAPLARALARMGTSLSPSGRIALAALASSPGRRRRISLAPALGAALEGDPPDALLSAGATANLVALAAVSPGRARPRVVVAETTVLSEKVPGRLPLPHPSPRAAIPRLEAELYPHAAAVVAVSERVADDLAATVGLPRSAIHAIPNPVVRQDSESREPARLPHPWLADAGPPVVLAVGRLTRTKDHAALLRAFARLRRERSARLLVLGEGPERPRLERLARALDLTADVALPGFVPNPLAAMERAAVLVHTSRREGFGSVLAEALAAGCAVVATDCPGGPREILAGGRFGRLVPLGDDEALARAIEEAIDRPPERAALRARAEEFDLSRVASRYLDLLAGAGS